VNWICYVAEEKAEALSSIIYEDEAFRVGRKICETLKETLPSQQFVVKNSGSHWRQNYCFGAFAGLA
jgi:translation elongation factor EF-4